MILIFHNTVMTKYSKRMLNHLKCVHQAQILFALMTNTELSEAGLGINQKNACLPFSCTNYP